MSLLIEQSADVLALIFEYVLATDLFVLEQTHSDLRLLLLGNQPIANHIWKHSIHSLWSSELKLGTHNTWRDAARYLEGQTWPTLKHSGVKSAVRTIEFCQMTSPSSNDNRTPWATPFTLNLIRSCLKYRSHNLDCRRQIALFACSSDFAGAPTIIESNSSSSLMQTSETDSDVDIIDIVDDDDENKYENIYKILSLFNVIKLAKNPEEALRNLLLEFPFLPIDAGEGADRVIYALANIYLKTHPNDLINIRNSNSNSESITRDGHTRHNNAESAVYILLYSIIMLNTDRHHPSIKSKMTQKEFIKSVTSTVVGEAFHIQILIDIFNSISLNPLKIVKSEHVQKNLKNLLDTSTRDQHVPSTLSSTSTSSTLSSISRKWLMLPVAALCIGVLSVC